ncbi:DUF4097 family beta strand repeat-containing protein [Actinomadura hibisca]|uniref:DUF4097 family beta strand repeat-containing protein n=1 Tax=Actinomadura hibisca TaxID=68565 RepID=UPI0008373C46|nr:DUF4097 family beta strand repeat-containing protein [Actinomadura hibisca]
MIDTRPPAADPPPPPARPRRRAVWIVLAACTALVLVVPAALEITGRVLTQTRETPVVYTRAVTEIRIDADDARVTFGRGEPGRVRLRERLTWAVDEPKVRRFWQGTVLWVQVSCEEPSQFFTGLECGADLDFQIPPDVKVMSTSSSGNIVARGLPGGIEMHTRSGSLELDDVQGPVVFEGTSGELRGRSLRSREVRAKVGSGSVNLEFAGEPADVEVRTGSGSIEVTVPAGTHYRTRVRSGSGGQEIDSALDDPAAPGRIDLSAGSGSIEMRYPRR